MRDKKPLNRHLSIGNARSRARLDIQHFARVYTRKLGVNLQDVKFSEQKWVWGTCDKDGTIRINWQLIHAPLAALEYVVAHEVVYLLHRHHGDAFWETLSSVMPDWRECKACLESWEPGLVSS